MSNSATFFELYLRGSALPDEIHDFISLWREKYKNCSDEQIMPLNDFLGLTQDEYDFWLHDEHSLKIFAAARETGKSLAQTAKEAYSGITMAARADSSQLQRLHEWLSSKHGK